jgi:hypothetical protein
LLAALWGGEEVRERGICRRNFRLRQPRCRPDALLNAVLGAVRGTFNLGRTAT